MCQDELMNYSPPIYFGMIRQKCLQAELLGMVNVQQCECMQLSNHVTAHHSHEQRFTHPPADMSARPFVYLLAGPFPSIHQLRPGVLPPPLPGLRQPTGDSCHICLQMARDLSLCFVTLITATL